MMLTENNTTKAPEIESTAKEIKKDSWIIVFPDMVLISQLVPKVDEENDKEEWIIIEPYVITNSKLATLSPYLSEYTNSNRFVLNMDKVITITKPNQKLQAKYDSM